jgi:hypothetical protein
LAETGGTPVWKHAEGAIGMKAGEGSVGYMAPGDVHPGDVVFTRSKDAESLAIRAFSDLSNIQEGWSHAALVIDPTIWFEAPGTGESGFYLRRPKELVRVGGKYAVRFENAPADKMLVVRPQYLGKVWQNFWTAGSSLSGHAYPKARDWIKTWAAAWQNVIARQAKPVIPANTIFCSQLVYLTLVNLETIPKSKVLGDFITPTELSCLLKEIEFPHFELPGKSVEAQPHGIDSQEVWHALTRLDFLATRASVLLNDTQRKIAGWANTMSTLINDKSIPIPDSTAPKDNAEFEKLIENLSAWWDRLGERNAGEPLNGLTYPIR